VGGREEFFGIRQYQPGDSLTMVDWKGTARSGELVSREMTQPSPPRLMLAVDFTGLDELEQRCGDIDDDVSVFDHVERAVSLAASVVCDAHLRGYQVGLATVGAAMQPFPMHHSHPHRTRLLEALALLDASARTDKRPSLPATPTVLIVPGEAQRRGGRMSVLDTVDLQRYVSEARGGAIAMLESRHEPTRRQQLAEAEPQPWN